MAACIKIVLSGNSTLRGVSQASLASQTVVFRNMEPGRHPAFTDFTIHRNENVTMRIDRRDQRDTVN